MMMTCFWTNKPLLYVLTLLSLFYIKEFHAAEVAPVCHKGDGKCNLSDKDNNDDTCTLYMAESTQDDVTWGIFAGVDRSQGEHIVEPDLMISLTDANKNEWSPLHDFVWLADLVQGAYLDNDFTHDLFMPGIPSITSCSHESLTNIAPNTKEERTVNSAGVHRSSDPAAGSFTYRYGYTYDAMDDLKAGEELFASCSLGGGPDDAATPSRKKTNKKNRPNRSIKWLQENGICMDNLSVGPSTIPGIGRGAFAKRAVTTGDAIAVTPLVHFDRSQLQIVEQQYSLKQPLPVIREEHGIQYTDKVKGQQLLLNYCYGHPDSNVLLLPVAPGVNFINHNRGEKANAYIRWEMVKTDPTDMHEYTAHDLLDAPAAATEDGDEEQLFIEIVALRDIQPGEEIFLDYGDEWVAAWEKHVKEEWKPNKDKNYVSAADFNREHANDDVIRTESEQQKNPYPENLRTACYYMPEKGTVFGKETLNWSKANYDCLRPCDVQERTTSDGKTLYTAAVHSTKSASEPEDCGKIPEGGVKVAQIPKEAITLVDKPYTSDSHLPDSFRHEIGVPEAFYPMTWMAKDPRSKGDFIPTPLKPGELAPIRWSDTGAIVTPNGFRLGLSKQIRQVLTDYCDLMGITDIFRHVTIGGNALEAGMDTYLELDGEQWYLQRPEQKWKSNLQWLSPGDNPAHVHYLQALSVAGFDEMLKSIGEYFNMDGLVAFHVTFIAVSHSTQGYMHYDVKETDSKTFNVIVPLLLANETGPELDLQNNYQSDDEDESSWRTGRYRYEYEVASMMGDYAMHGSSAVDYRVKKEMRMAATVYIADVNPSNVDAIMNEYTQAYPPADPDLLLSWAGQHWKKDDPSAALPKPDPEHILVKKATTSVK